jgi:hypothetical protein
LGYDKQTDFCELYAGVLQSSQFEFTAHERDGRGHTKSAELARLGLELADTLVLITQALA